MLRRDIRLRREYLTRKSQEGKAREEYEKKMKIREALECRKLNSKSEKCSWEESTYGVAL